MAPGIMSLIWADVVTVYMPGGRLLDMERCGSASRLMTRYFWIELFSPGAVSVVNMRISHKVATSLRSMLLKDVP